MSHILETTGNVKLKSGMLLYRYFYLNRTLFVNVVGVFFIFVVSVPTVYFSI